MLFSGVNNIYCQVKSPLLQSDNGIGVEAESSENLRTLSSTTQIGPDAPILVPVPSAHKIGFLLVNDRGVSNNEKLDYQELVIDIPKGQSDSLYKFEGYMVFQLRNPSVNLDDESLLDPHIARLVFQTDLNNGVSTLYNWYGIEDIFSDDTIHFPVKMVNGKNEGLKHTFELDSDQFAIGDQRALVEDRLYYYAAIAYSKNNFMDYDPFRDQGQKRTFLSSSRNVEVYSVSLSKDNDYFYQFGDQPAIVRNEGAGNFNNFLQTELGLDDLVLGGTFTGDITYVPGHAPINVAVVDPENVKPGKYEIEFFESDPGNHQNGVLDQAYYLIRNINTGEEFTSLMGIKRINELIYDEFGLSVTLGQQDPPGLNPGSNPDNGFIGGTINYMDTDGPQWLSFIDEEYKELNNGILNFIKTDIGEEDHEKDPNQVFLRKNETGFFPYCLIDSRPGNLPLISPVWISSQSGCSSSGNLGPLGKTNNVDIVFTSDKSKWSRSVILEASNSLILNSDLHFYPDVKNLDLLDRPGASKEAGSDGRPMDDSDLPNGVGWFPGYAIDVETGKRLNIFFAENTVFSPNNPVSIINEMNPNLLNGDDRMWNPTERVVLNDLSDFGVSLEHYTGGQHFIYVTNQEYDGCESLLGFFNSGIPESIVKREVFRNVTWSGVPLADNLLTYEEGLIPNDVRVQLRVKQPFRFADYINDTTGVYNKYSFEIEDGSNGLEDHSRFVEETTELEYQLIGNPDQGVIVLRGSFQKESPSTAEIQIFNLSGQLIDFYKMNGNQMEISTRNWVSGMYLIKVRDTDNNLTQVFKWIKSE